MFLFNMSLYSVVYWRQRFEIIAADKIKRDFLIQQIHETQESYKELYFGPLLTIWNSIVTTVTHLSYTFSLQNETALVWTSTYVET